MSEQEKAMAGEGCGCGDAACGGEHDHGHDQERMSAEQAVAQTSAYTLSLSFVMMLAQKAWVNLGKIAADPKSSETKVDLPQAKFCIDTMGAVINNVKPHVSPEEAKELDAMLANLRLNFVSASK